MLSPLRNRFGIPGVISVIALVFAMLGGAYAASDNAGGGKATASAKAKKGPRGPKGPKGPAGPAGPQGPAGPAGAKGDTGAAGSNGTNGNDGAPGIDGTDGIDGTSVTTSAASAEECPSGGIKVTSASPPAKVCNGQSGFTATLPPEATETGAWAYAVPNLEVRAAAISFPIPLAAADAASTTVNISNEDPEEFEQECPGTAAEPKAEPGALCLYIGGFSTTAPTAVSRPDFAVLGVGVSGALLDFEQSPPGSYASGSFAVTAPAP
jgi:Collagen triple helix repeat (20 copies)